MSYSFPKCIYLACTVCDISINQEQYQRLAVSFNGFSKKYNIIQYEHYSAHFTVKTFYTNDLLFEVHNEKQA